MKRSLLRAGVAIAVLLSIVAIGFAQRRGRFRGGNLEAPPSEFPKDSEFHFIRLQYTDQGGFGRGFGFSSRDGQGSGWWLVDWPDAEIHFTKGIQRLTRIQVGEPLYMRLTDDRIFDNPWMYATQTGYWGLSDAEVLRLREYLLRGGYLVTDDFWGSEEWQVFAETMNRVLPNHPINDLQPTDSVMHVMYDIEEKDRTFIPGSRHLRRGPGGTVQIVQPPGTIPAWRAMYDDNNHMVVAANYNTDVADAWEFADVPYYPEKMTSLAYRYGINYLIYSMTH